MEAFHLDPAWTIALVVTCLFAIAYPLVLALVARRRLGVGWRYFWFGALIFLLFQVVTRIPAITVVGSVFGKQIRSSPTLLYVWLAVLVLTAALFEEIGRYIGYRWLMGREEKTWSKAVMYGLGHGGLESFLLVGLSNLYALVQLAALSAVNLSSLPAAQRQTVAAQLHAISLQPAWFPLLAGWERLWTIPIHVALSVIVVQVFRRHNLGWLGLAIVGHMVVDGVAVAMPQLFGSGTGASLLIEGVVAIFGLVALWIIWALRDKPRPEPAPSIVAPAEQGTGPQSMPGT
jgi:uncharacterized membrane protein YhfC